MKKYVAILLALVMLAAVFGPFAAPAAAQACAVQYTVVRGDNLYRIGVRHGVSWPIIAQVNNLANPNLIFIGQVLCIPAASFTPTPGTPAATGSPAATSAATATGPAATATGAAATATGPAATATSPAATATGAVATPAATATGFVIPTFTIESVVRGTSVTIRTANFPANQTFTVLMGPIGTLGVNGIPSGTSDSGAGGSFTATYTIPAALANAGAIAIRLQSPAGYYSYNWFSNVTTP